jgi:hypothetical protein
VAVIMSVAKAELKESAGLLLGFGLMMDNRSKGNG